ncbi:MAG: hypothetical protein IT342_08765 [Candidatus Melainabacteria bacterium]|nr:hypothetical protein [Candidatus Melainabacteria bacterium]
MGESTKDRIAELRLAMVHAGVRIPISAGIGKPYKSNRGNGFLCDVFLDGLENNSLFIFVVGGNSSGQDPRSSIAGQGLVQALGLAI